MFGLFLKLDGRLAVVVGGGPVGRRRAAALREAGASVRVVCLERCQDVQLEWLTEAYESRHLDGAALVIAAAPREVNARVVEDARARGILVCDAADPDNGDFVTPSTIRRGDVVVAVTTGVPALTKQLRRRLGDVIGPEYALWAALLDELRPRVLSEVPANRRTAVWAALTDDGWLPRLRDGREAAWAEMRALVTSHADRPDAPR